jgi:putative adhesin
MEGKQMNNKIAILFLCAGALLAQDNNEKATVPLRDPSRPARIQVSLMMGGITVRGADIKEVLVETHSRGETERHDRHSPARADGMKRLDLPGNAGLDVVEEDNVVTIKTSMMNRAADLVVTVPRRSSLRLKCMNDGDIYVEQVDGEIDANNLNGKVTLKNVSGSVVAHSLNGAVTASLDRIDAGKPMSFSTLNGDIDVTLPDTLKANVRMKTDNGEIYSDFEVKLIAGTSIEKGNSGRQADGSYHLRFDHALRGTINGGGPEFQFTSFNGQIYIRKKK